MSKLDCNDTRTRKLLDEGQSLAHWSRHCVRKSAALIRRSEALLARHQAGSSSAGSAPGRRQRFSEAFLANPG